LRRDQGAFEARGFDKTLAHFNASLAHYLSWKTPSLAVFVQAKLPHPGSNPVSQNDDTRQVETPEIWWRNRSARRLLRVRDWVGISGARRCFWRVDSESRVRAGDPLFNDYLNDPGWNRKRRDGQL